MCSNNICFPSVSGLGCPRIWVLIFLCVHKHLLVTAPRPTASHRSIGDDISRSSSDTNVVCSPASLSSPYSPTTTNSNNFVPPHNTLYAPYDRTRTPRNKPRETPVKTLCQLSKVSSHKACSSALARTRHFFFHTDSKI